MAVDTTRPGTREAELPEYVLSDLLGSPRRRRLLERLADCESARLSDLAAAVAAAEAGCAASAVDRDRYRAVRDDVFEAHLPKLVATGVVDYDSMTGTVTLAAPWIEGHLTEDGED